MFAQNEDFLIFVLQPNNKKSKTSIVLIFFSMKEGFEMFDSPIV
jgi:hypothetical protein